MPKFNESSALLMKRSIDAGITSPAELANIMGNASGETKRFTTMDEDLGYTTAHGIEYAVHSANKRFTEAEVKATADTVDVKEPSPPPAQSIQHIQQTDQYQAQIQTQMQATITQNNLQGQQGPTPGGAHGR